jgi:hypothetical protein
MTDQQTPNQGDSTINLTDLQNILVVLDLASSRGSFRGPELEPVGQLYNKIKRFIDAASPPAQEPAAGDTNG